MHSYATILLDQHLHDLTRHRAGRQLQLSRQAAERFAVLSAVRERPVEPTHRRRPRFGRLGRPTAARTAPDQRGTAA